MFVISLESFGIVFRNIKFNSRGIEGKDIGKGGIDHLAERFGEIAHFVEHMINVRFKDRFEAGKRDASGTLEKPQKSHNSRQRERKRISRESVGMEKIFCRIREERNPSSG